MTARRASPRFDFAVLTRNTDCTFGLKHLFLSNYQLQWSFCSQARNLTVYVEFRSSDDEVAKPLKVIRLRKTCSWHIFVFYTNQLQLSVTILPRFPAAVIFLVHLWQARRSSLHNSSLFHSPASLSEPRLLRWGKDQVWSDTCLAAASLALYTALCPQVKIELPTQLHDKHHLLFSFYHVTCDINAKTNAKRKESLETPGECGKVEACEKICCAAG